MVNGKAWTQLWMHSGVCSFHCSFKANQCLQKEASSCLVHSICKFCYDKSYPRFFQHEVCSVKILPSQGLVFFLFVCFSSFMHRSYSAVQTETWKWPGETYFQNNCSMPWQTINELTNDSHKICTLHYGTCLLIEQLNRERDGDKLPAWAWRCGTGHKIYTFL